ncbi:unnamed protein product, partial [Boreogadus saida]
MISGSGRQRSCASWCMGGVEEGSVQRVVSQLSGALAHLHAHGLVHRDLKPENVFLCDPAGSWVKLGDFGM